MSQPQFIPRVCEMCGREYLIPRRFLSRTKYCSKSCLGRSTARTADVTPKDVERFWSKVDRSTPTDCWLWTGGTCGNGYGNILWRKRKEIATRVSWEIAHGQPPGELFVLHTCDTPRCVNPAHLFLGTNRENALDAVAKGRMNTGERNGSAKLTEDDVRSIRRSLAAGERQCDLMRRYGVARSTMCNIATGKRWSHIR
jgi:hypothetical protein